MYSLLEGDNNDTTEDFLYFAVYF